MTNAPAKQATPILDLNQFANIVGDWFFTKTAQIDQLIEFPAHEPIKVQDNTTGEEVVLSGPEREAFIQGLKVCRTIFDVLPFSLVPLDAEGAPIQEATPSEEAAAE